MKLTTVIRTTRSAVTFWLLVTQLLTAGVAFILNILSSVALEPTTRGYLALVLQLSYLATTMTLIGVERPYVATRATGFADASAELSRLTRPGLALLVTGTVIGGLVALSIRPELGALILLTGLFVVTNVHVRILRSAYISSHTWKPYTGVVITGQVILLIAAGLLALLSVDSLLPWVVIYAASGVVPSAALIWSVKRAGKQAVDEQFAYIRRQGLKLIPASLGNTAMLRSDRLLMPLLSSPAALGIYTMAATAMELASWPVQQWCDSRLGHWGTAAKQGTLQLWKPLVLASAVTFAISIVLAASVWLCVDLLLSEAYQPAKQLLVPLILGTVLYSATRVQQAMLIAAGSSGEVSVVETAGMVTSIGGYLLLIPVWGAHGAAIASAMGYGVCFLLGICTWRKVRLGVCE